MTARAWTLGHRPELDAIRGIAILLVVVAHAFPARFKVGGTVGVALFFTLSGFLITSLLIEEGRRRGTIRLAAFYGRRARRLLPALVVFLATMLLLGLVLGPLIATPTQVLWSLLYCQNLVLASDARGGALGHTWTLSIEEQFYLLWPLLVVVLARMGARRMTVVVAAVAMIASIGLRVGIGSSSMPIARMYFGTDTNACLVLAGCLLALWRLDRPPGRPARPVAVAALAVACVLGAVPVNRLSLTFAPVLASGLAVIAIAAATAGPHGEHSPRLLVHVGRRAYGLYLWHYPLVWVVRGVLPGSRWLVIPALLAASWLLTWISWHFVEEPFSRRRRTGAVLAVRPTATVAVGSTQLRTG